MLLAVWKEYSADRYHENT